MTGLGLTHGWNAIAMILGIGSCAVGIANVLRPHPSDRVELVAIVGYVVGMLMLFASIIAWAVRG